MSIRIGILGYGNLGRGVECAIKHNPDTELVAVFTRRDPETVKILTETAKVYSVNDAEKLKDEIDVLIICGGSATDLPVQTPEYVKYFQKCPKADKKKNVLADELVMLQESISKQRALNEKRAGQISASLSFLATGSCITAILFIITYIILW